MYCVEWCVLWFKCLQCVLVLLYCVLGVFGVGRGRFGLQIVSCFDVCV